MTKKSVINFLLVFISLFSFVVLCSFSFPQSDVEYIVYNEIPRDDNYYNFDSTDRISFRLGYPSVTQIDYDSLSGNPYYLVKSSQFLSSMNYATLMNGEFKFSFVGRNNLSFNNFSDFLLFQLNAYDSEWVFTETIYNITVKDFLVNSTLSESSNIVIRFNSIRMLYSYDVDTDLYTFDFYAITDNRISSAVPIVTYQFTTYDVGINYYFSLDIVAMRGVYSQGPNDNPNSYNFLSNWTYQPYNDIYIKSVTTPSDFNFYLFHTGVSDYLGSNIGNTYADGYRDGFGDGQLAGDSNVLDWTNFITRVIGSPFVFLSAISPITVFGINIYGLLGIMIFISGLLVLFKVFR